MTIIIDASLAVKWFLDEADSSLADQILETQSGNLLVPPTFVVEVISTLVREANIHKAHAGVMRDAIARLTAFLGDGTISVCEQKPAQIERAANIAIDLGHPLKDCIYLLLAMELDCDLITADARFVEKAKGVWAGVKVLGE